MPMWQLAELQEADSYEPGGGASLEEVIAVYDAEPRYDFGSQVLPPQAGND